ncbi:hypothetical protein FOA52_010044 [Chlamydomonas sp. UWO 241]|nr:hypothetical protein FOA52_010044 [Chlamydomonas sp. UWO 241]
MTQSPAIAVVPGPVRGRPGSGATKSAPAPALPSSGTHPQEYLAAILHKIATVDKEGFFQIPVDEKLHHAPNYYTIIKHPICFLDMRKRLAAGGYTSFRQLREDFELICSNAKQFNKSTTKVYKAAGLLLQRCTKVLKLHELDIRKAFSIVAPGGETGGGGGGAPGSVGELDPSISGAALPMRSHQPDESGHERCGSVDVMDVEPMSHGHGAGAGPHAVAHAPAMQAAAMQELPTLPVPPLCTYISEDEGGGAPQPRERLDDVLARMRRAAVFQRWDTVAAGGGDASGSGRVCGEPGASASGAPPSTSAPARFEPSGRSEEWRIARRPIEWQCRWLELRLWELKAQRTRLRAQLAAIESAEQAVPPSGSAAAGGVAQPPAAPAAAGCSGQAAPAAPAATAQPAAGPAAAAPAAAPRPAGDKAAAPGTAAGSGATSAPASALAREKAALLSAAHALAPMCRAVPFFRLRMGAAPPAEQGGDGPSTSAAAPSAAAPSTAGAAEGAAGEGRGAAEGAAGEGRGGAAGTRGGSSGETLLPLPPPPPDPSHTPALAHASAELLVAQLAQLRSRLLHAFPSLEGRAGAGAVGVAGAARGGPGGAALGKTPGTGGRRGSGRLPSGHLGSGGLSVLTRADSSMAKRRRGTADSDIGAMASPHTAERAASAIFIPPVRELDEGEQHARFLAVTQWNDNFRMHGVVALSEMVPSEVEAVLLKDDGEGSSSEDTSDEAYARLHHSMEEEEHKRYSAVVAETQRKKANTTKATGKTPRGGSGGGGAFSVGRRSTADDVRGGGGSAGGSLPGQPFGSSVLPSPHDANGGFSDAGNGDGAWGLSPHADADAGGAGGLKRGSSGAGGGAAPKARKLAAGATPGGRGARRTLQRSRARGGGSRGGGSRKRRSGDVSSSELDEEDEEETEEEEDDGSESQDGTEDVSDELIGASGDETGSGDDAAATEDDDGRGGTGRASDSEDSDTLAAMAARSRLPTSSDGNPPAAAAAAPTASGSPQQLPVPMVAVGVQSAAAAPPVVVCTASSAV